MNKVLVDDSILNLKKHFFLIRRLVVNMEEALANSSRRVSCIRVLIILIITLMTEILRISGKISSQGLSDHDRLQRGSPRPMASLNMMPDFGEGLGSWNGNGWSGIQPEVS